MSKPITLFSGFVLKMLYEENPKYLGEVLGALVGENVSDRVGVTFRQQERKKPSVPDGLIVQPALTVYLETKNHAWFYDAHLENHLRALNHEDPGLKVLLALGNFEHPDLMRFERVRKLCEREYKGDISFEAVSFEDLIEAFQITGLPKNLADAISDLRDFLDEEDLLPSWQRRLDVVNCAGIPEDVLEGGVYMCPATGGSYSHARCKYFGMYRQKRVELVALIEAVVDVDLEEESRLKWNNTTRSADELVEYARAKVQALRPNEGPTRLFVLGRAFRDGLQEGHVWWDAGQQAILRCVRTGRDQRQGTRARASRKELV